MNLEKTPQAQEAFNKTMNGANMNTDKNDSPNPIVKTTATENTPGPMDVLRAKVEAAKAEAPVEDEGQIIPVTLADVAAAAFVALETVVQILKPEDATKVLDEFDARKAAFNVKEAE